MVFWLIVLGVVAVMLLLAWLHDRRRKGQLRGDMWTRNDIATGVNMGKGQQAEKAVTSGINQIPFGK